MSVDLVRYGRQIRLPEIGEAGQERLLTSEAVLGGAGYARQIEATYLRLAGVRPLERGRAGLKSSSDPKTLASLGLRDDAARDVADGALRALVAVRGILGIGAGDAS